MPLAGTRIEQHIAARGAVWLRGRRNGRAADPMNLIWVIPAEGSGNRAPRFFIGMQAAFLDIRVAAFCML